MPRARQVNPGLASRFTQRLEFPNWTEHDCAAAVAKRAGAKGIELSGAALATLRSGLGVIRRQKGWANARDFGTCYDMLYKVLCGGRGLGRRSGRSSTAVLATITAAAASASSGATCPRHTGVRLDSSCAARSATRCACASVLNTSALLKRSATRHSTYRTPVRHAVHPWVATVTQG